jgi:hypothetical protein
MVGVWQLLVGIGSTTMVCGSGSWWRCWHALSTTGAWPMCVGCHPHAGLCWHATVQGMWQVLC